MGPNLRLLITITGCLWGMVVLAQPEIPFTYGVAKGKVPSAVINEASGLVASRAHPGWFWTHNDSGDSARIFLIDYSATLRSSYYLEGITAYDWEDISLMTQGDKPYLLVADIGDNGGRRPFIYLHVVEEPETVGNPTAMDTIPRAHITTWVMKYEDGPRDAESLFFDPVDECIYVVGKRELPAGIYRTALPDQPADTLLLKRVGTVPQTFLTAADIRSDGGELLMKNLLHVFYWKRQPGESIPTMLKRPALTLPYQPEPQGEAITFAADGSGYYTLSESALGMEAVLYFYPRR